MTRLKLAELTSGVGALVLGVGIGAMFAVWFASAATLIVVAGLAAHAVGMWDKQRLEALGPTQPERWVTASYWLCWTLLGAVALLLVVRR
jgi:hypothetical protein